MSHDPHLVVEIRELPPDGGWARYERTGRACLVCSCGAVTGFIDKAEARRKAAEHPAAPATVEVRPPPTGPAYVGFLRDFIQRGRQPKPSNDEVPMPRLQILELPMEHYDTATMDAPTARTPFALILDGLDAQTATALRARPDALDAFAKACGARAAGAFEFPVDLS